MWYKYSGRKSDVILLFLILFYYMRKNTQFYIKITVFLLLSALIFGLLPVYSTAAGSKEMTMELFEKKLSSFKSDVYANGSHYIDNASLYRGTQCYGFANQIAQYFYGSFPTTTSNGLTANADWVVNYGSAALRNLHVGDVMRFRSSVGADHSIFITGMDDTYIYFSDCNNDHKNTVRHDAKKTWTELMGKIDKALEVNSKCIGWVAHYKYWNDDPEAKTGATVSYNANGGYIAGEKTADRYVVTTSALRMRAGAGLDKEILTRMVNGTYFDVAVGSERIEADGYTWAPVTQGDMHGWAAISDPEDCRIDSPVMSAEYYVNDKGDIYANGTSSKYTEKLDDGAQLASAEFFGLKLGNAEFIGWSTAPDGEPVKAEDIKESEDIIKLFAIWQGGDETTDTETSPETTEPDDTTPADMTDTQSGEDSSEATTTPPRDPETNPEETSEPEDTTDPPVNVGDVNGDGSINNKDITTLFKLLGDPDAPYSPVNDINGDGSVNNKDVTCLFKSLSSQPTQ